MYLAFDGFGVFPVDPFVEFFNTHLVLGPPKNQELVDPVDFSFGLNLCLNAFSFLFSSLATELKFSKWWSSSIKKHFIISSKMIDASARC